MKSRLFTTRSRLRLKLPEESLSVAVTFTCAECFRVLQSVSAAPSSAAVCFSFKAAAAELQSSELENDILKSL